MTKRITIDPVTRIEGHLRIDVEVDNGSVQKAWASCTMWRGIETILRGRDPREGWLFAQRFCGVCTTVHAMASVRAVEDALQLEIPANAQYIRNLILIAHALHDHIVHFYHLSALDWVDITTIPKADPARAASIADGVSTWPGNSHRELQLVQNKVNGLIASGQLGIFSHGYWGHPAMRLSPEMNLILFAHYLQALEFQRKSNQVVGILGGKTPHIQNLAVGGVMNAINLNSLATFNMDRLGTLQSLLQDLIPFVQQAYFADACLLAASYPEWFRYGRGVANYLAVPDLPLDAQATKFDLPGGVITKGNLGSVRPIQNWHDQPIRSAVAEDVTHAWYMGEGAQQPWKGATNPYYTDFRDDGKYTWVKAPRYDGAPMQVGPLANILVGYASGDPLTRKWVNAALNKISSVNGTKVAPEDLQSTMGRYLARAIRSAMLSDLALKHWQLLADNILKGDDATYNPPEFPSHECQGVGMHEAPRGTLSHWVVVDKGTFSNYQAVVPTTWNASPRDERGVPGPYESSLLANPVADPEKPLEVLRTVHSFDPCMACACHTLDASGREITQVKVL
ncbi:MAG TPA: nickel-dependent hydrogenase large subunit [Terriglobales bacterium]|nr:nickel-dependent hydrogenase large subunit [Terriglobales bacterium]